MAKESIHNVEDVLKMLDSYFREEKNWWDKFYTDRNKQIPFFVNSPDENLVQYFQNKLVKPGKILELGCGAGRNAIYMTKQGCQVDAIDLSQEAIDWGKDRAKSNNVQVNFLCKNMFDVSFESETYDFIYDCGCFHHILPHRRISYLDMINKGLKPGGHFGLVCFALGEMGAEMTDWEVYNQRSLKGGLGYSEQKLKEIFQDYQPVEFRRMRKIEQPSSLFGESFLWTALFRKKY
ncbi:class I SAM-dependent methyltransferase [Paenibacillus sp. J2TS4]|uniref:class I SAM-dependent methyltransferase n=1 Tax=Paenibacillus sp. J2TS4 TaxID=2807194 RepID=UPI001B11985B|nr:class I SAM-dependent methyltransferase [Paenibacillus sp. J2TS4]GIP36474.1 methyltransferase [Paenibacillus sp. J2TS4]